MERSLYQHITKQVALDLQAGSVLGPHPICSYAGVMRYSFDFAQQVHYPCNPLQQGPIFFKTPRKCGLLGVCCEAFPKQVNYLLDECVQTGKGANCVISLIHHFFEFHGLGETYLHLHADNCSRQNKNSAMMWYLFWCVLTGRHHSVKISFLLTGHTKFSCDWCFGLCSSQCNPCTPPYPGIDAKSTSNRRRTLDDAVLFYCLLPGDLVNKCW
jgi:hypothetical protein